MLLMLLALTLTAAKIAGVQLLVSLKAISDGSGVCCCQVEMLLTTI
jgi:hypothetical protein